MPVVLTYTTDMREQVFFHVLVAEELFPSEVDRFVLYISFTSGDKIRELDPFWVIRIDYFDFAKNNIEPLSTSTVWTRSPKFTKLGIKWSK